SPLSFASLSQMAARSSGMPAVTVYLVKPLLSAAIAASLMYCGVSKSGSPAVRAATSTPFAARALALAVSASVAEGLMGCSRRDAFMRRLVAVNRVHFKGVAGHAQAAFNRSANVCAEPRSRRVALFAGGAPRTRRRHVSPRNLPFP